MKLGTSYYPELVDESEWPRDLDTMRGAGLSLIRMLEFAWTALEPREGIYTFEWLDRFLELAHEREMQVILSTPTATPPAWLSTQYPEVLLTPRDGHPRTHGGRRDADTDSFIYRHYCVEIAQKLGARYGQHPAVIGWQIDNELVGPEMAPPEVHTDAANFRFRQWLKAKYGTVETLNAAWGMRFWSQEYSDWGEVTTPRNPRSCAGHVLDYARYFTHSQVEFLKLQRDALRTEISEAQWISHNSTGVFNRGIDHIEYAHALGVAGWDAYFGAAGRPHPEAWAALAHDLFRSAKQKPFYVFETNSVNAGISAAYWGEMRARGAQAVMLWHWREHRANAENRSNTICDYDGSPDESRLQWLRDFAAREELHEPLPETFAPRKCAILYNPDCVRAELTPDPYIKFSTPYLDALMAMYLPLRQLGIACDVVRPGDDLSDYKLVVMPSNRLMSEADAAPIRNFVESGGVIVATAKTGHQDDCGKYHRVLGEPLHNVFSFTMRRDVRPAVTPQIAFAGNTYETLPHVERMEVGEAQILGTFEGGELDGCAAVVSAQGGRVIYAAACSQKLNQELIRRAAALAQIELFETACEHLSSVPHWSDDGRRWFFNHGEEPREIAGMCIPPRDFCCSEAIEDGRPQRAKQL